MNRKKFLTLTLLLFTVFVFGGCGGGEDKWNSDLLRPGKYRVMRSENVTDSNYDATHGDSYINVFHFKESGYDDYEIYFSGLLLWYDEGGHWVKSDNFGPRRIILTETYNNVFETKYVSDPDIMIDLIDYENFDFHTKDYTLVLEYGF